MNPAFKRIARPLWRFFKGKLSKRKIRRILRQGREIRLDAGSGDRQGANGWLTIDRTSNCDIHWDLRKGLPFPDGSVAGIYSSHFLEHLSFSELRHFLDESVRVLVPGGAFSVCVPNARLYIETYIKGESDAEALFAHKPAHNRTTAIDGVNYIAYMNGDHKYMFDGENLVHLLRACGLRNARLRGFDPHLDLEKRRHESIYAEAEK